MSYEKYFSHVKLATRMHDSPRRVISSYIRQKCVGNLLDLTEPSFSSLFPGIVLDSTLLPKEWFIKTQTVNYTVIPAVIAILYW